jgi:hypothetical protein
MQPGIATRGGFECFNQPIKQHKGCVCKALNKALTSKKDTYERKQKETSFNET